MPPLPSQKGTGKKGGRGIEARPSRSRNTTPAVTTNDIDTAYLEIVIKPLRGASYDDIVDPQGSSAIPDSKALEAVVERINKLIEQIEARDQVASKGIRLTTLKRKERAQELEVEREVAARAKQQEDAVAAEAESRARKANKLKKKTAGKLERPLTHGAHGLAPQDGSNIGTWNANGEKFRTDIISAISLALVLFKSVSHDFDERTKKSTWLVPSTGCFARVYLERVPAKEPH